MNRALHLYGDAKESFFYAADWVQKVSQQSIQSEKLSVIVLPHQEMAIRLRKILAVRGSSFMNVHFWTPERLRFRLLREEDISIASREALHLILSSVASDFVAAGGSEALLARAVESNPALLLRVLDMLEGAGLNIRMFESLRDLTELADAFYRVLERQGLQTVSAADRLLASREMVFESLCILGFHGGHWPLFPLLSTACRSAKACEILLDAPRDASFEWDSTWIGTWEEVLKIEALPLESQEEEEPEGQKLPVVEFLAAESTHDLARGIALQAAKIVGEGAESVAVVFSSYGTLSREVALALNELEIPHYDALGHVFSDSEEAPLWQSWCAFQKAQTVQTFAKFLALLPDHADLLNLLQRASREALSQDIRICREFARIHSGGEEAQLAAYSLLPARGSFAEFCDVVQSEFSRMGWWKQVECLRVREKHFRQADTLFVGRDVFLRWLKAALRDEIRRRDPMGSHPYAVIQLLRRDQAALCPWTHVILAGMNAGEWPEPVEESGFLPADAITDFNCQMSSINTELQIQGTFGEGHLAATRIPCLGSHHLLQRRDFQSLRQVPHLVATTRLKNDANPAIPCRPSLWFSELFHELRGKPPSWADLRAMLLPREQQKVSVQREDVAAARSSRLDASVPFGPWEFSTHSSVDPPPSLAVVEVERILYEPAAVWMKTFLGVESPEEDRLFSWMSTAGTWTHRWLRSICDAGVLPDETSRRTAIISASEMTRSTMERACRVLQRKAAPWWTLIWEQARSLAFQLSDQLEVFRPRFSFAVTETSFRDVPVTPLASLLIRGRWDLVLCDQAMEVDKPQPFADSSILIIDYKTGKDLKISSILRDGTGIQLALYSHAALAWGAQRVDTAWVTPHTSGEVVHLPFEELEKIQPILSTVGRMVRNGIFGMRGELRSEFAFRSPLPLATLSIPQDVLEAKWKLTHDF